MTASDAVRRRSRLARGPVTIGEPAPFVDPKLPAVDPYRPDTIADGGSVLGLTVRGASVRGLAKRYAGGPRQDDFCLAQHAETETLVIAVADGVSGAVRSEMGAALAVRYAAAAALRQLDAGARRLDWDEVFRQAAWALVEEQRRFAADPTAGADEAAGQLATTLLVAAVHGEDVQVAAVGDSPALVLTGNHYDELVPGTWTTDDLLGGVGVPSLPRGANRVVSAETTLRQGQILLMCTDGLSTALAGGDGEVGRTLARELRRPPDAIDFARLLDFSRATYDDDRTLVAVWQRVEA